MSKSDFSGFLFAMMWITTIIISIGSGIIAWNWIDPKSFWGAVIFLLIWGVFSKIGHFIAIGIFALFGGRD